MHFFIFEFKHRVDGDSCWAEYLPMARTADDATRALTKPCASLRDELRVIDIVELCLTEVEERSFHESDMARRIVTKTVTEAYCRGYSGSARDPDSIQRRLEDASNTLRI